MKEEQLKEDTDKEITDSTDINEVELIESTEDRLAKTFETGEKLDMPAEPSLDSETSTPAESAEEDDSEDGPTLEEKKEEEKLEAEAKAKAEAEADEEDSDGETKDGETKDEGAKDEDANKGDSEQKDVPQLSDAYVRAAIHMGWTEGEIKEQYAANPELTVRTLGRNYEAVNRASTEFASIGRYKKQQQRAKPAEEANAEENTGYKGTDIKKLREEYPDDGGIIDLVEIQDKALRTMSEQINGLVKPRPAQETGQPSEYPAIESATAKQEEAVIAQQVEIFFREDGLKSYDEFYGTLTSGAKNWDELTPAQKMNRWAVIEKTEDMLIGAEAHGREMNVDEALNLSHLVVTEPIREKIIRKDIMSKLSTRSKSLTLVPSSSNKAEATGSKSTQELESATEERLGKIFG